MGIIEILNSVGLHGRKHGDDYVVSCFFHNETKPSLSIDIEKGFFHCFSCGRKGSMFDLIRAKTGSVEKARLLVVNDFYDNKSLKSIVQKRIYGSEKVERPAYLDYPLEWRYIYKQYAEKWGVELLRKYEIGFHKSSKALVYPIKQTQKDIVAFHFRCVYEKIFWFYPKGYVKNELFGEQFCTDSSSLVVVEGVNDLLNVVKGGFSCVALLGSKVSDGQLKRLSKFKKLILMFDKDKAGNTARDYLIKKFKLSKPVCIAEYDGEKPSSLLAREMKSSIKGAKSCVKFMLTKPHKYGNITPVK